MIFPIERVHELIKYSNKTPLKKKNNFYNNFLTKT